MTVNDNGGTAQHSAWTMTVTGNNPDPASFPGDFFGSVRVGAGAYSLTASGPAGYAVSYWPGCAGTTVVGGFRECFVDFDDQPVKEQLNRLI
jgi:hypothetical protein